jgi:hypothetical protein
MAIKFLNTVAVDTDVLYVDASSNRVGIGTTSPGAKLDVVSGDIRLGTNATYFRVRDTASAQPRVLGMNTSNTFYIGPIDSYAGGAIAYGVSGNVSYHGFYGGGSEKVRITSSGSVGIGTTSPSYTLDVNGVIRGEQILYLKDTGGTNRLTIQAESSYVTQSVGALAQNFVANYYRFYDDAFSEMMRIADNGNVGIGSTSPTALLTLESSSTSPYPGIDIKSTSYYPGSEIRFLNSSGSEVSVIESYNNPGRQDITVRYTGSTSGGKVELQDNAAILGAGTSGIQSYAQVGTTDFRVNTNFSTRMYINTLGNVGIGTTAPAQKLHVIGNSEITGDIFLGRYIFHNDDTNTWIGFPSNDTFTIRTNGLDRVRVTSGGNFGIGTASPAYTFDVTGEGRFTGDLRCLSLIQTSERDYKKDIRLVGKENSTIPIKEYKYKTGDNDKVRYGVVAEDIESTYPELVETDAEGIKGVKYIDLLVRKIAELETEKRTLVNWRHYHSNTSYNTLYDTGMTTAFPYAYGTIPAPYDMYFTSVTLVNNPYSSYNKGPLGDTATFQAYINGSFAYEVKDIRYGQNPHESITADFGQNVRLRRGESLQIRFQANGTWRYCNSTIILTEI